MTLPIVPVTLVTASFSVFLQHVKLLPVIRLPCSLFPLLGTFLPQVCKWLAFYDLDLGSNFISSESHSLTNQSKVDPPSQLHHPVFILFIALIKASVIICLCVYFYALKYKLYESKDLSILFTVVFQSLALFWHMKVPLHIFSELMNILK